MVRDLAPGCLLEEKEGGKRAGANDPPPLPDCGGPEGWGVGGVLRILETPASVERGTGEDSCGTGHPKKEDLGAAG